MVVVHPSLSKEMSKRGTNVFWGHGYTELPIWREAAYDTIWVAETSYTKIPIFIIRKHYYLWFGNDPVKM